MNISLSFFEIKSLESTILYNDSQHNILALQGKANKQTLEYKNNHKHNLSSNRQGGILRDIHELNSNLFTMIPSPLFSKN
jgi:hypothetical protein